MAYVRCEDDSCGWAQDDCWSPGFNPFQVLHEHWGEDLLKKDLDAPLDKSFDEYALKDMGLVGKTWRDFFVYQTERAGKKIIGMKWKTEAEFKADPDKKCPKCGGSKFVWD